MMAQIARAGCNLLQLPGSLSQKRAEGAAEEPAKSAGNRLPVVHFALREPSEALHKGERFAVGLYVVQRHSPLLPCSAALHILGPARPAFGGTAAFGGVARWCLR
jgi:hypothetical protein